MGILSDALDWMAKQVQDTTGETRRRELVNELKRAAERFKALVEQEIRKLNDWVEKFNCEIIKLNEVRRSKVGANIGVLQDKLVKFGNCKPAGAFAEESSKEIEKFPQKQYDNIHNYIDGVDWSSEDVFWKTFQLSALGMKIVTRNQNLTMQEKINALQMETEETVHELSQKTFATQQDTKICQLYLQNITFIADYIKTVIIPEFELVEAFFQAEKLKDEIIAKHDLQQVQFTYDITCLKGTIYEKHYRFVRNAYMFYIVSCRVYETPVLTRLLNSQTTADDIQQLEREHRLLEKGGGLVKESLLAERGAKHDGEHK